MFCVFFGASSTDLHSTDQLKVTPQKGAKRGRGAKQTRRVVRGGHTADEDDDDDDDDDGLT